MHVEQGQAEHVPGVRGRGRHQPPQQAQRRRLRLLKQGRESSVSRPFYDLFMIFDAPE